MWICLNDAFLSIVEHNEDPDVLLVRARRKADLKRAFPKVKIEHTPKADYPYRAFLPREAVALAVADHVRGINYGNFKNSVIDHDRHAVYFRIYNAAWGLERGPAGPVGEDGFQMEPLFHGWDPYVWEAGRDE